MQVTLNGVGANRSARCRWVLEEAGVEYTAIDRRELAGPDELRQFHPLDKIPAAVIDGETLFESAAICTYIADRVPAADLIAKPGTFARAEHDQWVAFCLSEMEAWLWNLRRQHLCAARRKAHQRVARAECDDVQAQRFSTGCPLGSARLPR